MTAQPATSHQICTESQAACVAILYGGNEAMHMTMPRSPCALFQQGLRPGGAAQDCRRRRNGRVDPLRGREEKRGTGRATATLSPVNMQKCNSYRRVTKLPAPPSLAVASENPGVLWQIPSRLCPAGLVHQGSQPAASICHAPTAFEHCCTLHAFRWYAQHMGRVCCKPMYTFIQWL